MNTVSSARLARRSGQRLRSEITQLTHLHSPKQQTGKRSFRSTICILIMHRFLLPFFWHLLTIATRWFMVSMSLCYLCLEVFNIILLVPIPRVYAKHQGKLYEPGTCTSKNSFSPLNFGSLAFREVESNRILLHISWSGLSKTPYSRMHWSRFDQFMIFASKGASVQRPGTTEPQVYYFDMNLLAKMPTFEDLGRVDNVQASLAGWATATVP
jgi:hypothetical protein